MIPFTRKAFYAFEAVCYIALHHSTHPISGKKLADVQNLPPRYLEQIMQKLVHAGVLRSIRGPRGGYVLARERRKITMGDIFDILQDADDEQKLGALTPLAEKVIHPYLEEIGQVMTEELRKTTLADLCEEAYSKQATGSELFTATHQEKGDFII
jgi:Rrf2 family iron-sulfur cluster assembly transcriptional regulator